MSNRETFEAFIRIVEDKITEFSDSNAKPNLDLLKDGVRDRFDDLIISQGFVSKDEYESLEMIARRLESRLDELEKATKSS